MSTFDIIILVLMVLGIVLLLFAVISLILSVRKKPRGSILPGILLLVLGGGAIAGSFYTQYYQATTLADEDNQALVTGYYLTEDLKKALTTVNDGDAKSDHEIQQISKKMSAFGLKKANIRLEAAGQKKVNRYYTHLRQTGVNLGVQRSQLKEQPEMVKDYLNEIEKLKKMQQDVFDYFSVSEEMLK